ncbi:DUF5518 domain-containing protein [Haloarcula sp. S1CR25-12]|uniref:DUF5518 domain-containing protein n=1 Tax=Haloarcula saliterrae TaxID=2950534 RepID=A0ABU2FE02_9EURY|nr:DUF5518 domain-containing protein [Haloarcula sp. S1CR25-12]MDS0259955.1 DUF5518 domain-containing protein [Haloarcula sp. S1CR25-12]
MNINWRAVLTGFVVAIALGAFVSWAGSLTESSVYLLALPGLVGGFVAGYMVSGVGNGAIHGALATIVGALVLLVALTIGAALFVGVVPAVAGASVAVLALFVQAIPGGVAGAIGGWMKRRRVREPTTATTPR